MAQIRHIAISNFRCIEKLDWFPASGINCLIGPGDAGKSSILDAIDYCLGALTRPPAFPQLGLEPGRVVAHERG